MEGEYEDEDEGYANPGVTRMGAGRASVLASRLREEMIVCRVR